MNQKKNPLVKTILGIETSCDDTSIAIVSHHKVIANRTFTKISDHEIYGGIIPEIASRNHAIHLNPTLNQVLNDAHMGIKDLDAIAYTAYPGLPGCLHTGKVFAKTLATMLNKPLMKIDHMIAHAYSFAIDRQEIIKYPFICLDASGGHTIIYLFYGFNKYLILNQSNDDAVGECLDKVGRMLGLKYPGGISLDQQFDPSRTNLPLIKHYEPSKNFSFSGIKTFVSNYINQKQMKKQKIDVVQVGSSVLQWCIDELIIKLNHYLSHYYVEYIVIGGGVAANSLLRNSIKKLAKPVVLVEKKYTGDNAAMIANLADLIVSNH